MDYMMEIFFGEDWQNCRVIGVHYFQEEGTLIHYWNLLDAGTEFLFEIESFRGEQLMVTIDNTCDYTLIETIERAGRHYEYKSIKVIITDENKIENKPPE